MDNMTACCGHLRVSYRTEEVRYDGPDVPSPPDSPHVGLRTGAMLTRGWWECEYGCGMKFLPAPLVASPVVSGAPSDTEELNPERLRNTAGFLRSLADKLTYRFNDETRAQIRREADYLDGLAAGRRSETPTP